MNHDDRRDLLDPLPQARFRPVLSGHLEEERLLIRRSWAQRCLGASQRLFLVSRLGSAG